MTKTALTALCEGPARMMEVDRTVPVARVAVTGAMEDVFATADQELSDLLYAQQQEYVGRLALNA